MSPTCLSFERSCFSGTTLVGKPLVFSHREISASEILRPIVRRVAARLSASTEVAAHHKMTMFPTMVTVSKSALKARLLVLVVEFRARACGPVRFVGDPDEPTIDAWPLR